MTLLVNLEKYLISLGIDDSFLIKFYENLLLSKNNELHSKDLIIKELFNKEESN